MSLKCSQQNRSGGRCFGGDAGVHRAFFQVLLSCSVLQIASSTSDRSRVCAFFILASLNNKNDAIVVESMT